MDMLRVGVRLVDLLVPYGLSVIRFYYDIIGGVYILYVVEVLPVNRCLCVRLGVEHIRRVVDGGYTVEVDFVDAIINVCRDVYGGLNKVGGGKIVGGDEIGVRVMGVLNRG